MSTQPTPTPQTDELHERRVHCQPTTQYFRLLDLARQLERQRDEALDALRELNEAIARRLMTKTPTDAARLNCILACQRADEILSQYKP